MDLRSVRQAVWGRGVLDLGRRCFIFGKEGRKWKKGILIDRNAVGQSDQWRDEVDLRKTKGTCPAWKLNITRKGEIIFRVYTTHTKILHLFPWLQLFPYSWWDSISAFPSPTNPDARVAGASVPLPYFNLLKDWARKGAGPQGQPFPSPLPGALHYPAPPPWFQHWHHHLRPKPLAKAPFYLLLCAAPHLPSFLHAPMFSPDSSPILGLLLIQGLQFGFQTKTITRVPPLHCTSCLS